MMEQVTLPPEDADVYTNIPTITEQSPTSAGDGTASSLLAPPIIRYTSAAAAAAAGGGGGANCSAIPPPLRSIVTDPQSLVQGFGHYTTFCTQVHYAQTTTFHYPPTPPVDGSGGGGGGAGSSEQAQLENLHGDQQQLAITQCETETPASGDKAVINPFPSLPTPPDIEALTSSSSPSSSSPSSGCQRRVLAGAAGTTQWIPQSSGFLLPPPPPPPPPPSAPAYYASSSRAGSLSRPPPPPLQPSNLYYPALADGDGLTSADKLMAGDSKRLFVLCVWQSLSVI